MRSRHGLVRAAPKLLAGRRVDVAENLIARSAAGRPILLPRRCKEIGILYIRHNRHSPPVESVGAPPARRDAFGGGRRLPLLQPELHVRLRVESVIERQLFGQLVFERLGSRRVLVPRLSIRRPVLAGVPVVRHNIIAARIVVGYFCLLPESNTP